MYQEQTAEQIEYVEKTIQERSSNWMAWVNNAIHKSVERENSILIIEKFTHICQVYYSGKYVKSYPIELGSNWHADKKYIDDNATPEGQYYVTRKLDLLGTQYYKSLQISFPSKLQKEFYQEAFENKQLDNNSVLNAKISIHGGGNKGYDWTNGSIALDNNDLKELLQIVKIGTLVIIVGTVNIAMIKSVTKKL